MIIAANNSTRYMFLSSLRVVMSSAVAMVILCITNNCSIMPRKESKCSKYDIKLSYSNLHECKLADMFEKCLKTISKYIN